MVGAGSVLVGAALYGQALYNAWKPRRVGIYGTSMVGKTTLDRYMTTPGEMEEIAEDERTEHFKLITRYMLPKPTRKRIGYDGEKRVVGALLEPLGRRYGHSTVRGCSLHVR